MAPSYEQEIVAIREWLVKEDYLPKNFDDVVIRKFLHSCYGSLEQTKRCIEKFSVIRCSMPELYTNRDPLSKRMQTAYSITHMGNFVADDKELILHEINDPELEKFNFYDILKGFTVCLDHWILTSKVYPDKHIYLMDMKHYYLKIIPKCNFILYKQFVTYLLETMPIRLHAIHLYNCPTYYDTLYSFVKPVLPQEIKDIIHFHFTLETLHEAVGKENLPVELGGNRPSMIEQDRKRNKEIQTSYRDIFKDDKLWKADMTKLKASNVTDNMMSGSFKTLDID